MAIARVSLLRAVQVVAYDVAKRGIVSIRGIQGLPLVGEGQATTQILSSLVAGLATTTVTNPLDCVNTVVTAAKNALSILSHYTSTWHIPLA